MKAGKESVNLVEKDFDGSERRLGCGEGRVHKRTVAGEDRSLIHAG